MKKKALIFIPDISGFTKFVTSVEIEHSQHIVSELLDAIISADELNLTLSEIEGDAVLFYKTEKVPDIAEVYFQAVKMFKDFHTYLKIIERDNICRCGACLNASNLSLKFIAHYGELVEKKIHNIEKIMGPDVIIAHRLLKNKINRSEYLLVSGDENYPPDLLNRVADNFTEGTEHYDDVGDIGVGYTDLGGIKDTIVLPKTDNESVKEGKPKEIIIEFLAPLERVEHFITDFDAKFKYVQGIRDIKSKSKINRLNSSHLCIFENDSVVVETVEYKREKGKVIYTEKGKISESLTLFSRFELTEKENKTLLNLNVSAFLPDGIPIDPVEELYAGLIVSLNRMKEICETEEDK